MADLFLGDFGRLTDAPCTATGSVTFGLRRNAAAFTAHFARETARADEPVPLGLDRRRRWVSIGDADDTSLFVGIEKWCGTRCVPFEGSYGYGRGDWASDTKVALRARNVVPEAPSWCAKC